MNKDQSFASAYSQIVNLSLLITLILSIILLVIGIIIGYSYYIAISYFLGAITNILGFTLIKRDVSKQFDDSNHIKGFFVGGNLFRYVLYAAVLVACHYKSTFNIYFVAAGILLTVRIAIYIYSYLHKSS